MTIKTQTIAALLLTVMALCAANAPVQQGLTSKQVAFKYSRPDTGVCTWEVSTSATYSPLVADTVGSLGQDTGTLGGRWFVVGTTNPLAGSTLHYWRQTCGAEVYTGQFTTLAPITASATSTNYSAGGMLLANNMQVNYGPTPALGSSITVSCTPRCSTLVPAVMDSLLFVQSLYLNQSDVVATGSVHLVVMR